MYFMFSFMRIWALLYFLAWSLPSNIFKGKLVKNKHHGIISSYIRYEVVLKIENDFIFIDECVHNVYMKAYTFM